MTTESSELIISSKQKPVLVPVRLPKRDSTTCLAWEAFDRNQGNRHYFIKQMREEHLQEKALRDCFIKEYNLGCRISSPYLPRYISITDTDTEMSLTMDFIDGDTLEERMAQKPQFFRNAINMRRFIYQMLEAMDDIHSTGILHLDLKPQNIMLTRRTDNVRIIDLGYSRSAEWDTTTGMSQMFASPEQLAGDTDTLCAASDIFTFGRIIQHITAQTGCRLPKAIRHIIDKCTQDNIEKRYSNTQQITEDIDVYYNRKKSNVWRTAAISAAATLLIVLGSISFYRFWYAEEFTVDGFSYKVYDYHGVNGVMITDADAEVIKDSTLSIHDNVTFHGRTYNVIAVDGKAFFGNNNIRNIEFNPWIHEIGNNAFFGCPSLRSVYFAGNVRSVNNGAFASCESLDTFIVNKSNPWLYVKDSVLFSNEGKILRQCPATKKGRYTIPDGIMRVYNCAFQGCRQLTHITIPRSVIHLDSNAFQDCTSLKTVSIPPSTPELPNSAFYGCTSLESIELPEGVEQISWYVFNGCNALSSVSIPSTCINIGPSFQGCNALADIYNHRPTPQDISDDTFTHYGTLHVPAQSIPAYRKHPVWRNFKIVAI